MTTLHVLTNSIATASSLSAQTVSLRSWQDYRFHASVDWLLLDLRLRQPAPLAQLAAHFGEDLIGMAGATGIALPAKSVMVKLGPLTRSTPLMAALSSIDAQWGLAQRVLVPACQLALELTSYDELALSEEALRHELAMLGASWAWFSQSAIAGRMRVGWANETARRRLGKQGGLRQALLNGEQVFRGELDSPLTQQVFLPAQGRGPTGAPVFTGSVRMQLQVNGELGWLQLGRASSPALSDFSWAATSPAVYRHFRRTSYLTGDRVNRRVGEAFRALERRLVRA